MAEVVVVEASVGLSRQTTTVWRGISMWWDTSHSEIQIWVDVERVVEILDDQDCKKVVKPIDLAR